MTFAPSLQINLRKLQRTYKNEWEMMRTVASERRAIMEAPTARYPDAIAMAKALRRAVASSRK